MKKTLIYAGAAFLLFGTSCKETLTPVVPSIVDTTAKDSTYMAGSVETPEDRNIYIEEFTGVRCKNCPQGATIIESMIAAHSNIISISHHTSTDASQPFTIPWPGQSKQDFRTNDGELMASLVFDADINNKPVAIFDRAPLNAGSIYFAGSGGWPGAYTTDINQYGAKAPVNVTLESKYNEATNRYDLKTTVKYTTTTTTQYSINLYLTEEGLKDVQEQDDLSNDTAYLFHHVFRKAITGSGYGKPILPDMTSIPAGTVYIYSNSFNINPDAVTYGANIAEAKEGMWKPANMYVTVAITLTSGDKHVVQAKQVKLTN